jgi:glycosyltransferase involved in cell wall biosynthesis
VVAVLTDRLERLEGVSVTLFCAPGSHSRARMVHPLAQAYESKIGSALQEVDYLLQIVDYVNNGTSEQPFDVVHDHTSTGLGFAPQFPIPLIHTMHNGHEGDRGAFYLRHGSSAHLVAISEAQRKTAPKDLLVEAVIPNPIDVEEWPFKMDKMNFALWMGRFDPVKGAHLAIRAARIAGMRLVLAGPIQQAHRQYFETEVKPYIDGAKVVYVGEVGGIRKKHLLANASCCLMPIEWNEPFGMVPVEAMACGTPVIAFPYGAMTEIVIDGVNGYQVADVAAMAEAMTDMNINPGDCRESVEVRYDASSIAEDYCAAYEKAKIRG